MSFDRLRRLTRTVGFRIAAWHAATFVAGAILVFLVAYFLLRRSMDEQIRDAIEFRVNQFTSEYDRSGRDGVIELCSLRKGRAQKAFFVRLGDAQNNTTFLRDFEDWSEFQPEKLAGQPVKGELAWSELRGLDDSVLQIGTVRLSDGIVLQVGKTLEAREALLSRFRTALMVIAAIVTVAGVVGGASVAFRALRPVHELTAIVRSILGTGKFTARVPSRGTGDEIDELVQCFNAMLGKIDVLIRGMRDSLDNVAHDLRTPMTRLRNIATKAVEQDYDKAACQEALGDCLEESERVLTMLVTLMDIAEAESGVMTLERKPVNVVRLIGQVVDLYGHVAEEKQINLVVRAPEELMLSGDAGRLQRALGNLVDNALKYTPAQGRVLIGAVRRNGTVTIEVSDNGEGIPPDDLNRIWERLYRVDKSRSQRGLGLGLSFVKAIVEAHGGQVRVESTAGSGSRFIVELQSERAVPSVAAV